MVIISSWLKILSSSCWDQWREFLDALERSRHARTWPRGKHKMLCMLLSTEVHRHPSPLPETPSSPTAPPTLCRLPWPWPWTQIWRSFGDKMEADHDSREDKFCCFVRQLNALYHSNTHLKIIGFVVPPATTAKICAHAREFVQRADF